MFGIGVGVSVHILHISHGPLADMKESNGSYNNDDLVKARFLSRVPNPTASVYSSSDGMYTTQLVPLVLTLYTATAIDQCANLDPTPHSDEAVSSSVIFSKRNLSTYPNLNHSYYGAPRVPITSTISILNVYCLPMANGYCFTDVLVFIFWNDGKHGPLFV
ncbi:hypothetical protein K440DRAFT_289018 [Wilcoxina mikolae CBS 423.85]|nr:hypothetical protein K440DRAFT_289018 [Wilcoxina mikolae CBS 423.85]